MKYRYTLLTIIIFFLYSSVVTAVTPVTTVNFNSLGFIIGVIGICGLFIFLAFKLGKDHQILNILLIMLSLYLLLLVPSELASQENCISFLNATNGYEESCTPIDSGARTTLIQSYTWFLRAFGFYILLYLIWFVIDSFSKVGDGFKRTKIGKGLGKIGLIK